MAQAKIVTEQEFKRALLILRDRRHADRDRLALLLTHWAGMRVSEYSHHEDLISQRPSLKTCSLPTRSLTYRDNFSDNLQITASTTMRAEAAP